MHPPSGQPRRTTRRPVTARATHSVARQPEADSRTGPCPDLSRVRAAVPLSLAACALFELGPADEVLRRPRENYTRDLLAANPGGERVEA
ncbi:hypothetical protein [Amycolatopsis benzoatilytica]|uniref:hypothetical protein n=1 Tax=Amycolatopsis benzoatilytica TaxID=346045 RepID=UPI00039FDA7F|nr:hypothetical protein [Amycolatopsis benzoatilytica]